MLLEMASKTLEKESKKGKQSTQEGAPFTRTQSYRQSSDPWTGLNALFSNCSVL